MPKWLETGFCNLSYHKIFRNSWAFLLSETMLMCVACVGMGSEKVNSHGKHRNVLGRLCWGRAASASNKHSLDDPFHYKSVIWLMVRYGVTQNKSQGKRRLGFEAIWVCGHLGCGFYLCCSWAALLILLNLTEVETKQIKKENVSAKDQSYFRV